MYFTELIFLIVSSTQARCINIPSMVADLLQVRLLLQIITVVTKLGSGETTCSHIHRYIRKWSARLDVYTHQIGESLGYSHLRFLARMSQISIAPMCNVNSYRSMAQSNQCFLCLSYLEINGTVVIRPSIRALNVYF